MFISFMRLIAKRLNISLNLKEDVLENIFSLLFMIGEVLCMPENSIFY